MKGVLTILSEERKRAILDILQEKPAVSVGELSDIFNVSDVTIRKVLKELDGFGYLKRTRGGAVSLSNSMREFEEKEKEKRNIREKKAIARCAYDYIRDGDTAFFDAGSTTLELIRLIKNGNKRNIVVVTNAINLAVEMIDAEDIELILIGGNVRHRILSCVGGITEKAIEGLFFDKVFLGTNSFDIEHGITTPNIYEAQVKQCMLRSAKQKILLTDSSKFHETSLAKVCPVTSIDLMITDWNAPPEYVQQLRELGVNVAVAEPVE
ncbi:DeoR family transcriptional regulator [Hydrogenispora ethanolica]|jgi:DeoR/GlpR family transcriptional regulator of sugar metabolism|uniref:DeoR family transcriptional regulator n=1 Tax=Hydrogenispora ethanolica TaxID=1082276 RepID=A0A4R1S037_HYDET|nr:DeoR/GlpR family DNA-binding transcription regulator [Hydrogenispora ethanolica]TCL71632.1 DeoR family transcriptional regulator [Hydrogenispora ethanolica]